MFIGIGIWGSVDNRNSLRTQKCFLLQKNLLFK